MRWARARCHSAKWRSAVPMKPVAPRPAAVPPFSATAPLTRMTASIVPFALSFGARNLGIDATLANLLAGVAFYGCDAPG